MTTEEKLQHFLDTCMEDARDRSNHMLDDYMTALEKTFAEHQADANRRAQMQLRQETEKIERDINKKLSIEQIDIKRTLGQKQEELKDKLFVELKDMLANFLETQEYQKLLEVQVQHAVDFAGGHEVTIYLDPVDEDKVRRLALHHGNAQFKVSDYSFTGGMRAVIPSRHILIDNSFQTKLAEAKENFHFDLSLTEGGHTNG
ncbi:MAG: V-type ATP synthase subunit E [Lachnospiraceae bacterium]|nr:V-type ATP synthase subunit E [Lachnospiraceae bacterium]